MSQGSQLGPVPRVVVCGTSFGRLYLRAIQRLPADFELAGILARGSAFSRECAAEAGVPLFVAVEEVPSDVDILCVVVRSAVGGGAGAEIAQRALERGFHVLQEHPVHHDELVACLRQARRSGVQYQVNAFYEHLDAVSLFLRAAAKLRARQQPLFVDAMCASQVLFPVVNILGEALGGFRPWQLTGPSELSAMPSDLARSPAPYRAFHGVVAGVPVTLQVQNQIDPRNPDNHAHLLHRIALGAEGGVLTLLDAHGPVIWSPRLHANKADNGRLIIDGKGTERLDARCFVDLGTDDVPTFRRIVQDVWPSGIGRALQRLRTAIEKGIDPMESAQAMLTTCRIWQDLLTRLGSPELVSFKEPQPLALADLVARP